MVAPRHPDIIAAARRGDRAVRLTPGPLPAGWLDQVKGLAILCLASAGGQLDAGFLLAGFHEDHPPRPRFLIDR